MKIAVTLVLPAYNEEPNIERAINDARPMLEYMSDDWEIVVVDDGSRDKTADIVKHMAKHNCRIRLVQHAKNKGYGQALITGFYSAKKEWVWLSAADNQFEPREILKLLPFANDYDMVAGCRHKRQDPAYRRLYARLYNGLIQTVLGIRVKDLNCGFKLIRRRVFDAFKLESQGALIDAELFKRCSIKGFSVKEVAVEHKPRELGEQTGGNLFVVIGMFVELLKLKMRLKG